MTFHLFHVAKKVTALLKHWSKDNIIHFPEFPFCYYRFEGSKKLSLLQTETTLGEAYVTFRKIFNENHKAGEIKSQEGAINISNHPFPKHNDRGKAHGIMVSLKHI